MPRLKFTRRQTAQCAIALSVCAAFAFAGIKVQSWIEGIDLQNAQRDQKEATLRELYTIRYRLEAETTSAFYLVAGLVSYIGAHPDLSASEFEKLGRAMQEARPGLINVAAAPDMVIRFMYPLKGNEAAVGLDYMANEKQREAALEVKRTGKPVVAGPVDLVQGGRAIIGRFPVFTGEGDKRRFWGIVSTPMSVDDLYEKAGLLDDRFPFEVALRGRDGTGATGAAFFGDNAVFEKDSVRLPVNLFSGSWELAAFPKAGWTTRPPNTLAIRLVIWGIYALIVTIVAMALGYIFRLERSRSRERSLSEAKSKFLASMSHEIRTPLNAICGVAQLLRHSGLDDDQGEWAEMIVQSTRSLNELLSDVLNLGKLESGRFQVNPEPIELEYFVDSVISIIRIETGTKGIAFRYSGVPPQRRTVVVDPVILRQILWNLLSNAVKFTEKGEIRLDIEPCSIRRSGASGLCIVVSDTGVGIAEERLPSIFDEYVQEDASTRKRFGGTGLGLAIVKRLIDQLGGEVSVRSRKGVGSRFEVVIPVRMSL